MKLQEIETRLRAHPLFETDIPIQVELGLPEIYVENGQLYLRYHLHKRSCQSGELLMYSAQFELVMEYPFRKIFKFQKLEDETSKVPAKIIDAEIVAKDGCKIAKVLYEKADQVISQWEAENAVSEKIFKEYKASYEEAAVFLG